MRGLDHQPVVDRPGLGGIGDQRGEGGGLFGPELGRVSAAIEGTWRRPEVRRRIGRLLLLSRLELLLLVLIVADMVFKPGL